MFKLRRPNLSWLFALLCFVHFPAFGMYLVDDSLMDKTYELDELRKEFTTILEMQPKIIHLDSSESQYKTSNGIYKLIPYYEKLCPELTSTDIKNSRFIIHKHVISGQWQLTEFDSYPLSKNIKAFPVTEEDEENALLNDRFIQSQNIIHKMQKEIKNMQAEVTSKNETIESLKNQKEILTSFVDKTRKEMKKKDETQKEMKSKSIEKENEIREFLKTQNELKSKLIEKENEIRDFLENQNELKSKIIEKENNIRDFYKAQNELEAKLIEKDNQIRNCEKLEKEFQTKLLEQKNKIYDFEKENLKTKEDVKFFENENQIKKEKLSKYQKLNEKLEFENKKLKLREKLLDKEIEDLYVSNQTFKKNSKQTKDNLQKYELQELQTKEEILKFNPNLFQNVEIQQEEETEKVEMLNTNHYHDSTEKFKLDFEIESKVMLNLVDINTEEIKEEEKNEVEESQTPKMEITSKSKQKSKNSKVRTKLNFQSNDETFEKKQESVLTDENENKQILENENFSQEEDKTKVLEKKQRIGFLNMIAAQVAKQDKEKENLQQLSESKIDEKQEPSTSKNEKKKQILENPSISKIFSSQQNTNIETLQKEATRFQDGLIKMKEMHKNIKKFYANELQIEEKKELCISKNQKKKDILNKGVNHVEVKCLKNVQMSEELMKKDGTDKKITQLQINKIAQILHGSRPSNFNYSKTMLDEGHVVIKNQIEQHKILVEDACERLKNFNDEALSSKITLFLVEKEEMQNVLKDVQQNVTDEEYSKIRLFLETQHALGIKNANYQYELLFMHHGSIMLLIEKFVDFRLQKYSTEFGNTYKHILEKIYQKYRKIQFDELLIIEDQKTKIKIKCFQDNRNLYYAPQYKYEMMFMIIGFIYGAGDILNELVSKSN